MVISISTTLIFNILILHIKSRLVRQLHITPLHINQTPMKTHSSIQKYILLAFALCSGLTAHAQTIAIEDFDGGIPSWSNDHASLLFQDPSTASEGLFVQTNVLLKVQVTWYLG